MAFYKEEPFDDFHRFMRPAAAVAASMGADSQKVLEWLRPEPIPEGMTQADVNTMRAFGFKPGAGK